MGEDPIYLLRERLLTTELSPRQIRLVLNNCHCDLNWRFLWLNQSTYLAVSWKKILTRNSEIDSDEITEFAISSGHELAKIATLAGVVFNRDYSVSALLNKFVLLIDNSGRYSYCAPSEPHRSVGPIAPVMFLPRAISILEARMEAARIFYDANNAKSDGRRLTDYFRVIEAGFGVKGGRLKARLVDFLASGDFNISGPEWDGIKSARDKLSHAYEAQQIMYDSDAAQHVGLVWGIAADVLVHKKNWGQNDSQRIQERRLAHYVDAKGTVRIVQGFVGGFIGMKLVDSITGEPMHLSPGALNQRYRRYADFFIARMKSGEP